MEAFKSGFMWPMLGFAGLIAVAVLIAYFAARQWGRTRAKRQIIFTIVSFAGIVCAAALTLLRPR